MFHIMLLCYSVSISSHLLIQCPLISLITAKTVEYATKEPDRTRTVESIGIYPYRPNRRRTVWNTHTVRYINIRFGTKLCRQIVCIPMVTYCAPRFSFVLL